MRPSLPDDAFRGECRDQFDAALAALRTPAAAGPRLSTGLRSLDGAMGGGLLPDHLVLLAGRPGVGKSTLAMNVATGMGAGALTDRSVAYVSLELSAFDLNNRIRRGRQAGGVPGASRRGPATPESFVHGLLRGAILSTSLERHAESALRDEGLFLMPDAARRSTPLAAVMRFLAASVVVSRARGRPLGLAVVDGLGRLETGGARPDRAQLAALQALRAFARTHRVAVITAASLAPGLKGLPGREPQVEDLVVGHRRARRVVDSIWMMDAPPLLRRPERPVLVRNQGASRHCGVLDVMLVQVPQQFRHEDHPEQLGSLLDFQARWRT